MKNIPCISITVAICTYNRADFLNNLLKHLLPQIRSYNNVELLIVNNNSSDNTGDVANTYARLYSQVKVHCCHVQGLSYARNLALQEAQGEWIGYLDDDAYPENDWLSQAIRIVNSGEYDAFGGVYYPWYKDGKKKWFEDSFESNSNWIDVKEEGRLRKGYFSGGNCFIKKRELLNVGGFPSSLGMSGKAIGYGEETYVQRLMALKGARLGFSSQLVIYHYTPLSKQTIRWACIRHFKYGESFWRIYQKPLTVSFLLKQCKVEVKETIRAVTSKRELRYFFLKRFYVAARFSRILGLIKGYVEMKWQNL